MKLNDSFAGSACHQESCYLQEIAQEVAMRQGQHVWVDGSLSDAAWFSKIFSDIRDRFPHYRIGIFYIAASEATIRARIKKRSEETGRSVPESQILRSLENPEKSLRELAPKTDLVVRIMNEDSIVLKSVEDHSGNWARGLGQIFSGVKGRQLTFPDALESIFLDKTSLVGNSFSSATPRDAVDSTKNGLFKVEISEEGLELSQKLKQIHKSIIFTNWQTTH